MGTEHVNPGLKTGSPGLSFLAATWFVLITTSLALLWRYESTPGREPGPPASWPGDTRLVGRVDRPQLLVFAHPKCPCTRATLAELARIQARCADRVDIRIVFVRPPGVPARWEQTDLWRDAEAIPGSIVEIDEGGVEAQRFGVATSGYTLLYGIDGRLQFSGGITGSRGHAGDNPGEDAILTVLATGRSHQRRMPAFGCSLLGAT